MHRLPLLLLIAASVGAAACAGDSPAEVINAANDFPVTAKWSAAAAPIAPSTVSGALTIEQHLGFRMNASFTITGSPNDIFQWRIFRGDCATNVEASDEEPNGLSLYATVESYPDITVGSAGTGSASPAIAGYLDSLTVYSVRIRPAQESSNWDGTDPIACGDLQRAPAS